MKVRAYHQADRGQVVSLWAEVFGYAESYNEPGATLEAKLAVDGKLFVLVDGTHIKGTVMTGYDGHRGWLYLLCVSPELRGEGWGKALVQHALSVLSLDGCRKVNLQVRPDNHAVVDFYRGLGFDVEERISMGLAM